MTHSTISRKFQTTIPLEVRRALKLSPRQRLSYQVRPDGSVLIRPVPSLVELFGSVKVAVPAASPRDEKQAAGDAIARDAVPEGHK